jgi:adenylate cyclase
MLASEARSYRFGRFEIDARSACLRCDSALVSLRPQSFDVLAYLVRNRGRLVSKDELIDNVWSNVTVTDNSLVQCIKDIRRVLGDAGQTTIETVAKRGYVFVPGVVEIDQTECTPFAAVPTTVDPDSLSRQPERTRAAALAANPRWAAVTVAGTIAAVLVIISGLWLASSLTGTRQPTVDASNADTSAPARRLSIAVLPFGASDNAASDDYFSNGISEDIASALGRFSDLAVASPKVASRFRGVGASAEDIGRQLKIRYLVEGSIRKSGEKIRIAVRLTDLPRGILLWSNTYDTPAETIFAVQDEITVRIAGALVVKLTNLEERRAANKSTGSMEAYDFVLRGRELLTRLNRASYSQARNMFEHAIALDPRFAPAYVGLGRVELSAVALGWTPDAGEALERAQGLARKAISLDEFNPSAHVLLGRAYVRMGEYDRAVDALKRAVTLNPSEPDSYAGLGDALLWSGDVQAAIKALETALSIDSRLSAEDLFSLGVAYFIDGNDAASVNIFERVTTRDEGNPYVYAMLAGVYAENRHETESRSAAAEVGKLDPFFDAKAFGSLFKKPEDREKIARALKKAGF